MENRLRLVAQLTALLLLIPASTPADDPVDYNRDIRPLLAARCFACHGPDEDARESDLRLDEPASATADLGGYRAIAPGDPMGSELLTRVTSTHGDEVMPPADAGPRLSNEEVDRLRRWIAAGADYGEHWAFAALQRPRVPEIGSTDWPRNPIDYFVLQRLESAGLTPADEADPYTLIRRVSLDLTGLPPTPAEADAFAADTDPEAYEALVARLLESQHYGERWARVWLDLARYADTNGYEKDRPRSIWPYRDWVIGALNDDMPFDQFTIEQLAGDMLPDPTPEQRIATGFHRNTMLNEEGGIDPLEFRYYALVDRVATTGLVWMGLTTGCAQCHSHKYDPITHTDYYRLMALLDNADEREFVIDDPRTTARRRALEEEMARLESELASRFPPLEGDEPEELRRERHRQQAYAEWLAVEQARAVRWTTLRPDELSANLPRLTLLADNSVLSSGDITKRDVYTLWYQLDGAGPPITALRLEALPDVRLPAGGPGRAYYEGRRGDFFLSEVKAAVDGEPVSFSGASHSYGKISVGSGEAAATNVIDGDGSTGWSTSGAEGQPHQLVLNLATPLPRTGRLKIELLFERHFAASLGRFRLSCTSDVGPSQATTLPVEIEKLLTQDPAAWSDDERETVQAAFLRVTPLLADARQPIDALRQQLPEAPTTMVFEERPADHPRKTFRHHRGEYLSLREEVTPGVPGLFGLADEVQPRNRLEFARWLVSEANPLASRVAVNRAWQSFFGEGLVPTSGDYGTQSEAPSHPELLDWLACELMADDWSLKELHRLIVTSATYRQDSRISPELLQRDPDNHLLARASRVRVDAETVRDLLLKASGLLSSKVGGPSVYPPQPASVTALAYGATPWESSTGEDRYRRSLYTFSKRTAPFAAYDVFDAPTGEMCTPRRDRSNTPLQALTLLNDEMYQEMARALAQAVCSTTHTPLELRRGDLSPRAHTAAHPGRNAGDSAISTGTAAPIAGR